MDVAHAERVCLPFRAPFTCIISGPTSCGKSVFAQRLVRNSHVMIEPKPDKILWCFSIFQKEFIELRNKVEFHEGLPDLSRFTGEESYLLILDDLLHETNKDVEKIFTRVSHHKRVSVVYLSQNLFHSNKQNRMLTLNSHHLVLFKILAIRDRLLIWRDRCFLKSRVT